MIAFAEKRDFLRMPIDCSFSFTMDDDNRQHRGKVINLSYRGVLFTSRQRLEEGALVEILLAPSHPTTAPTRAKARVARVVNRRKFYEIACKFSDTGK